MTLGELLARGEKKLKRARIEEWKPDAWYLLEYVTGCTRNDYFLDPKREVSEEQVRSYERLTEKRSIHIPLQHLTGSQEFMGLSFCVNEDVLIPRQDTEILVEEAMKNIRPGMSVLDVCTGSGCILISILKLIPGTEGAGLDLSKEALAVAERNCQKHGVQTKLIRSDLFEKISGKYDRIISNPPYIPTKTIDTLTEEVRGHEPRMALDGHEDGLHFYREIVREAPAYLKNGGMLFFEIGCDQADAVDSLMERDFTDIRVVKDLSGLDRVVYGSLRA